MSEPAVCSYRKLLIRDASLDQVTDVCKMALKEIGLKVKKSESTKEGTTSIFAAQGALIPLTMKILSHPFGEDDYLKSAQRSGIHLLIAPATDGVHISYCGIALNDATGRPEKYPEVTIEEVTDTLDSLEFEDKFLKALKSASFKIEEIE
jgi:hypothetical protein